MGISAKGLAVCCSSSSRYELLAAQSPWPTDWPSGFGGAPPELKCRLNWSRLLSQRKTWWCGVFLFLKFFLSIWCFACIIMFGGELKLSKIAASLSGKKSIRLFNSSWNGSWKNIGGSVWPWRKKTISTDYNCPEINSSPLKSDWKTTFLLKWNLFSGHSLVFKGLYHVFFVVAVVFVAFGRWSFRNLETNAVDSQPSQKSHG